MRTIWTPFTKCWGSNTMHMLNLDVSREITRRCIDEKWSQEFFNGFAEKHSYHIDLKPGQSWLFNQELIHGNVNNNTGITRVSMDLRIMLKEKTLVGSTQDSISENSLTGMTRKK